MYYNIPLFSCNAKLWRFFGFIEYENYNRAGAILVLPILLAVGEFLNLIYNLNDLSVLTMGLFMFAINLNSIVRILIVMKQHWEFIDLMEFIEDWYTELEMGNDTGAWKILKHLPGHNRLITTMGYTFGTLGGIATVLFPLLHEERRHPYSVYFPGCDPLKSPLYEIIYAVQAFVGMPFMVTTYIPFTNLFISWLTFGISLFQILRHKLENLQHHNDHEMLRKLKELIKFHQTIISYAKSLEDIVSFVSLVELVLFTTMLVVLLACFLLMDNIIFKISTSMYIFCMMYALFIPYWHTNEFSTESQKVADAAYSINWTHSSLMVRKCILIVMIRSQTTLKIRAGGVVPMTLETFQSLLNASYSYFTMLRGMMDK